MSFFACYLLTPVATPQRLRCTYVGFTVSPTRRIRQHNGELVNGAKRTARHRPWEMIVVVHGFPSKFHALQFEWAWQHPYVCRFTKERLKPLQGTKGLGHPRSVKRKLVELHEMLHVAPWASFPLTVSYTNHMIQNLVRTTTFFRWPSHMSCEVKPLHEFAKCQAGDEVAEDPRGVAGCDADSVDRACYICDEELQLLGLQVLSCYHERCRVKFHSLCLADHFLLEASMESGANGKTHAVGEAPLLRPERGSCPDCAAELLWPLLVRGASVPTEHSGKTKAGKKRRRVVSRTIGGDSAGHLSQERDSEAPALCAFSPPSTTSGPSLTEPTLGRQDPFSPANFDGYDDAGWFEDDSQAWECSLGSEHLDDEESHGTRNQQSNQFSNPSEVIDLTN